MSKFKSRKLFAFLGSVVSVVLVQVGLPEDMAKNVTDALVYLFGSYIVGQGAVDAAEALKK